MTRREARSADAYDLYLRGRNFENQRTPAATERAVEYHVRATEIDPEYARAWSGLSIVLAASLSNGDAAPSVIVGRARDAATRALQTGPESPEAQQADAYVKWCCDWDWAAAESGMRRAARLDPDNAMTQVFLGHILSQMGRHGESASVMRRARELDPLFAMAPAISSQTAFQARDYSEALALADRTIVLDPEFWIRPHDARPGTRATGRLRAGHRVSDGCRAFLRTEQQGDVVARVHPRQGRTQRRGTWRREAAGGSVDEALRPAVCDRPHHAGLGDKAAGVSWLDRAYEARDVHLMYLPVDAKWDPYRNDPRFVALLARCGFEGR